MKLKQPQGEDRATKKNLNLVYQILGSSEDHEMTPKEYAAEMLEETTHCRNQLVEPAKTTLADHIGCQD